MPQIDFDIAGAREHGYTDDQIADVLAQKAGFDSAGARQAGFDSSHIINRLASNKSVTAAAVAAAQKKTAEETGTGEALLIGAGHTFDRIGKGMQQGWYALTGNDKAQAELKRRADDDEESYQPLKKARPFTMGVGETLPAMAVPAGGAVRTAAQAAVRLGVTAGVMRGAEYGSSEERAKEAAIAGASTMVGGLVIPKIAQAAGAVARTGINNLAGKFTPEALALYDRAKSLGIPVNVAQLGDSKFLKVLASSLEQVPFTGAGKWVGDQKGAFTRAVSKTFGEDTDKVTPEVYAAAKKRLGDTFNDLTARNELHVTPKVQTALEKVRADAQATGADDTIRAVENILGRVGDQSKTTGGAIPAQTSSILGANGQPIVTAPASATAAITKVPGATYQSIDTELGNMIKAGGEKGMYAKRVQTALREGMDQSISPADQAAWQTARSQYRNMKAVRDVVAKNAGNGDVPPTALTNALLNTEAGKEAMASGTRGELGELSQIGRQFVRDQVPNSGTAQRYIAMSMLGGGAAAGGTHGAAVAGSMIAGGATTGRLLQAVLTNPKTIEALRKQGISMADLAKMPPSRLVQVVGGVTGGAVGTQYNDDEDTRK